MEVQSVLVAAHALFWYLAIPWLAQHVARPWMDRQPFRQQWAAQWRQRLASANGVELDADYAYSFSLEKLGVALQHGLGALLQVPVLLGLGSAEVGTALACHGALTEVGWELQDLMCRLHGHYLGGAVGRSRNPAALVRYTILHHALGLTLVVPLNCYLRGQPFFQLGVFALMGNASFSLMLQSASFALDVKTARGLAKMKFLSLLVLATMLVMRGYMFALVMRIAVPVVWAAAPLPAFCFAFAAATAMAYINFIMIRDATRKVAKYWTLSSAPVPASASIVSAPPTSLLTCALIFSARPKSVKLPVAAPSVRLASRHWYTLGTSSRRPTSAQLRSRTSFRQTSVQVLAPGATRLVASGTAATPNALAMRLSKRATD